MNKTAVIIAAIAAVTIFIIVWLEYSKAKLRIAAGPLAGNAVVQNLVSLADRLSNEVAVRQVSDRTGFNESRDAAAAPAQSPVSADPESSTETPVTTKAADQE